MEFVVGLLTGLFVALLSLLALGWVATRPSYLPPSEPVPPLSGQPAAMAVLVEPFLAHQLRAAIATAMSPAVPGQGGPTRAPIHIEVGDSALDLQPGQRAVFSSVVKMSILGVRVQLQPVTDFRFFLSGNRVRLGIAGVQLGRVDLPRMMVDRLMENVTRTAEERLNHSLLQLQQDTGVVLSEIETTDDLLILKFVEPENGRPDKPDQQVPK